METSPVPMDEIPGDDQSDNKENVVLRSLTGDPNRHTPLAEHRSPSTTSSQVTHAASMYTVETRYQPIPARVLPKATDPGVYYIDSTRSEDLSVMNGIRDTPFSISSEKQSITPTAFLEPKIISQPILYSIIDKKTSPITTDRPITINKDPPSPIIYSITGSPRRPTIDMSANNLEVPATVISKSPTIYSLVDTPRSQNPIPEPTQQFLKPSPNLYSVVGNPARTSRGVQVGTLDPVQPSPILYTIVGDTSPVTDKAKEKRPPTNTKQPTEISVYTLDNQTNALKAQQQQPQPKPTLYALVGKQNSPPQEYYARPPVRKAITPPITTNRRVSRSFEHKPEKNKEEFVSYPITKTKRPSFSKEPKNPKSKAVFIPFDEQEPRPRPQIPRQPPPAHISPEQIHHKPYVVAQNQPIQLPDYRSPYAYPKHKPYREQKYNHNPLPVVSGYHSDKKTRPPLYEPRYRVELRQPYAPLKPTSLERYPVSTKPRSTLWDNGYQTQTDDDEEFEQRINKKKRSYKTARSRGPWVPVW